MTFQEQIQQEFLGFTKTKPYETDINHAPKRKEILSSEENWHWHAMPYGILNRNITINSRSRRTGTYGRIYMYRLRPDYEMRARQLMNIRKI
jgi:urocanate hydratase